MAADFDFVAVEGSFAFLIVLRPFKAGNFVTAGGITGTVKEIGLFVTTINTLDNVLMIVGNNKIFGDARPPWFSTAPQLF